MLQFLVGLSSVNLDWLTEPIIGTAVYNAPPLFFAAAATFIFTGFWAWGVKKEAVTFLLFVAAIGISSAIAHGITLWHVRQILAFFVSASVWIFLYQLASTRDIITRNGTWAILTVYFVFMIIALVERVVFRTGGLVYLVSSIFTDHPEFTHNLAVNSNPVRLSYFSEEPSAAALAIAATIMPYACSNVIARRNLESYCLLFLSCVVLYFAEGMTSQLLLLFSVGFVILPRISIAVIPIALGLVLFVACAFVYVLQDRTLLIHLLYQWFGGISSRIDLGLASDSYISRLGTWFIGGHAILSSPLFGQGFGGTSQQLFDLAKQGYDVTFTGEQQRMLSGVAVVANAQMVVRMPSEIGMVGSLYVIYRGLTAFKLGLRKPTILKEDHFAFLYVLGAMLVTFVTDGEYGNPLYCSFVVLLAQTQRKYTGLCAQPDNELHKAASEASLPGGPVIQPAE